MRASVAFSVSKPVRMCIPCHVYNTPCAAARRDAYPYTSDVLESFISQAVAERSRGVNDANRGSAYTRRGIDAIEV